MKKSACACPLSAFQILVFLGGGFLGAPAYSQVSVTGITDKGVYNDRVTFTVGTGAGFDCAALLDSHSVQLGTAHTVGQVDYHELALWATNRSSQAVTNFLLRFNVLSSEREGTENGLPPWIPYPPIPSTAGEMAHAHLRLLIPRAYPVGMPIPVVARVEDGSGGPVRVNGTLEWGRESAIPILRGAGSGFVPAVTFPSGIAYTPRLNQLTATHAIQIEDLPWLTVQAGNLSGTVNWPESSRVSIQGNVTITSGSTVTIGPGTVVRLSAGSSIILNGRLVINGSTESPVVFTPALPDQPWGGFYLTNSASSLEASFTIFTGSGADPNAVPQSHRTEQCLFFMDNHSRLALTNSAAISLAGQFGHGTDRGQPWNSVAIVGTLIQRCTTGGEWNGCSIQFLNSALIEVPAVTPVFDNADEDGFYFNTGVYEVKDSLIGWTRDDGIDAGGGGAGSVTLINTWMESTFHEGLAWSGAGRVTTNRHTVSLNCGQGIECGYSTTENSPLDFVDDCLVIGNGVGTRFGDNYDWTYNGFIRVTNSILIHNYRDVWGVNWADWTYRTNAMDIQGNAITAPNPYHPNNAVWLPETDARRLALFMTTPPDAPVGVGLAVWSPQFSVQALTNPIPVRLSSFTTNQVSVDFRLETEDRVLSTGTVRFAPGETVKSIGPLAQPQPGIQIARLRLVNPTNAEITGYSAAWFLEQAATTNAILVPFGARWRYLDTGTNAGSAWKAPGFNDSGWPAGLAELGYGDDKDGRPEVTKLSYGTNSSNKHITYYFRHDFDVVNHTSYGGLVVRLKRDDGGIVYLNGKEIFRSNMPDGPVDYLTRAGSTAADDGTTLFTQNTEAAALVAGRNVIAVEIHQDSPTSSDISLDLQLEAAPAPVLGIVRFGSDCVLTWTDPRAVLETAEELSGPWSAVSIASPAPVDSSAAKRFYRLRRP